VITETRSPAKTLAYLLLIFFLPGIGGMVYLLVGINYRKRKLYNKKLRLDKEFFRERRKGVFSDTEASLEKNRELLGDKAFMARLLSRDNLSPVCDDTKVTLLLNGEVKYPALLEALEAATDHIHLEYYIFDSDMIGERIAEMLMRKAREGVQVRVIYDDFGSKAMSNAFERKLRAAGVEIYAFYKIYLILLARRLNYRDHRKIVVVDGKVGFLGGINISNHYSNEPAIRPKNKVYWRDTHLKLEGSAVYSLQYIFLATWNFCSGQKLAATANFFPELQQPRPHEEIVQIVSSGPDSEYSTVFLSFLMGINSARKKIRITTPYFIPNSTLLDNLKAAALAGVDVELLVPRRSDTRIVDLAAIPYYEELATAGVKVYRYKKGFVHAKTMTVDGELSIVGTANMDLRSFDFNFEANAVIYGTHTARQLDEAFENDLKVSELITKERWARRGIVRKLQEYSMRLLSSLL
jgi:cardiolipin synthase